MFCKKCGRQIHAGEKFCRECGEPVPEVRKTNGGKRGWLPALIAAVALAAVLILQNLSVLPLITDIGVRSQDNQETGYATPEKTISSFAEAIASNDINGALSLFACRHMTENYDYSSWVERLQAWQPNSRYSYPSPEGIFREATYEIMRGDAAQQIFNLCFSLKADDEYLEMKPKSIFEGDLNQILSDLEEITDLDQLGTFQIIRMDYTMPEAQNSSANQENVRRMCETYGAEDVAEYSVLYGYGGQTYYGGVTLIQYEQKWYIDYLRGMFANQNAYAYLEPMSEAEYCERIGI